MKCKSGLNFRPRKVLIKFLPDGIKYIQVFKVVIERKKIVSFNLAFITGEESLPKRGMEKQREREGERK